MDKTVSGIEDFGSGNSLERVPFWAVVVFYLFRLSVLGIALYIMLDIDSVEDVERVKSLFRESGNRNIVDYAEFVERDMAQATSAPSMSANGLEK